MFERIIDEQNHIEVILNNLQNTSSEKKIILYGAGYCGHETYTQLRKRNIPVYAICDDARIGQELDGFPITDINQIVPDDDNIIFVTSGFNEAMIEKLDRLGLREYYCEADFGRFEPEKETYSFFIDHIEEVERVYELFEDNISRELFVSLVNYKISRNSKYLIGMREDTPQYFPDMPDLRRALPPGMDKHVFLDLGAYDGDSIKGFLSYVNGNYAEIIAVEASENNYRKLQNNCQNMRDTELINIGISNSRKKISFSLNDAKNAFATDNGECLLQVDSVDNILNGKVVSFIKMDIEGSEYEALEGAKGTIRSNKPVLAISVYHLTEDLFRILLEIEEILPGVYKYYLRHYSPTMIETILYAVPNI